MSGPLMASYVTEKTVMSTEGTRLIAGFFWVSCCFFLIASFVVFFSGTLKRRRQQPANQQQQGQRHYRQPRENYQMGHMRRWGTLPLFFFVPSKGALHSKELPLILKNSQNLLKDLFHRPKRRFSGDQLSLMNSAPGLWGWLAGVRTAFIGNSLRWETVEEILCCLLSGLNLIILSLIALEWRREKRLSWSCLCVPFICLDFSSTMRCCHLQHKCRAAVHGVDFLKQHWDVTGVRHVFANNKTKSIAFICCGYIFQCAVVLMSV